MKPFPWTVCWPPSSSSNNFSPLSRPLRSKPEPPNPINNDTHDTMQLSLALILPAIASLASGLAVKTDDCACGIGAIYEVAEGHRCYNAECACPNYSSWWGEVDKLVQARCPTQSACESTACFLLSPAAQVMWVAKRLQGRRTATRRLRAGGCRYVPKLPSKRLMR